MLRRVVRLSLAVCGICTKLKAEHHAETGHEYKRNAILPVWHGWHGFRRGGATNLNRLGVDDSEIQRILSY